jgi:hypothetical protein
MCAGFDSVGLSAWARANAFRQGIKHRCGEEELDAWGPIACDFIVAVTAPFRLLSVFAVIEHFKKRLSTFIHLGE